MRRLIIPWSLAAALIIGACGQPVNSPAGERPETSTTTVAISSSSALDVQEESTDGVAGTFHHDNAIVAFSATTASDGATNAQIKLDERVMTASRNRATGQATWSGGGAVLTPADRTVLRSLARAFQDRWGPAAAGLPAGKDDQRDLLLRLAMLLAEAPLGVPLGDH